MTRTCCILLFASLSLACQPRRPPGFSSADTASDTDTDASTAESSGEETGIRLDIGNADVPADECQSIEQSTMLQELPSDVIIIADPHVDADLLRASVSNLSPELEHDGFEDTRIILIAGPPPAPSGTPDGNCDAWGWPCWDPKTVPLTRYFAFLERDIDRDIVLTELLAMADAWRPMLREDSWKHVWVYASRGADAMTSGPEFAAAFGGLGPSYANFAFHVVLSDGFVDDEYVRLARDTAGVHFPRDAQNTGEVYRDFVGAIEELLKSKPLSCMYAIPNPPDGQTFDPGRVNVEYDIGMGLETLGHVESVDDCPDVADGWYYDDVADPREVLFCPQTCGMFKMQELASIRIQFGCETIIAG
jgi:hypothetical protein